jgi:hypothetical protein
MLALAIPLAVGFTIAATPSAAQQAPAAQPYVVDYYYKAKWGYAAEFLRLFRKNHVPVLMKEKERGFLLEIVITEPVYHATEDGRWDYRVTLTWRDPSAPLRPGLTDDDLRQLFPDLETFRREEQRRFEILEAHWDTPTRRVPTTVP